MMMTNCKKIQAMARPQNLKLSMSNNIQHLRRKKIGRDSIVTTQDISNKLNRQK
jgi:hypothetical protein